MKNFEGKKIVITGATGGIGREICKILIKNGAKLILLGSNEEKLQKFCQEIGNSSNYIAIDLSSSEGIREAAAILGEIEDVDCLINLAGTSYFGSFGLQKFEEITKLYNLNILAPTILCQAVLPGMIEKNSGHIVNVGSIFGSIGFPFFATYSASKAALRTFSEALRREIADSEIKVSYIAPRAVKTSINSDQNIEFLTKTKAAIDDPKLVAQKIIEKIRKEKNNAYFGFAESKFVKINYLSPNLVDGALKKQAEIAKEILLRNFT